jgi:hypothetical protein
MLVNMVLLFSIIVMNNTPMKAAYEAIVVKVRCLVDVKYLLDVIFQLMILVHQGNALRT